MVKFIPLNAQSLTDFFPKFSMQGIELIQTYMELEGKVMGLLGRKKKTLYLYFRDFDPQDSENYEKIDPEECLRQAISSCEDAIAYFEKRILLTRRGSREYEKNLSNMRRAKVDLKALKELENNRKQEERNYA